MSISAPLMAGKKGLIMGVANDRSIAWGIARMASEMGAEIAYTYQGEALERRVRPLAEQTKSDIVLECDVTNTQSMDDVFATLKAKWGKIDFVVHAIGFSDKNELKGRYVDTTASNFTNTMLISCFSFTEIAKRAAEIMPDGGSLLTLSYYGAEKVMPNYNVMGVAKAALEASVRYIAMDLGKQNIRCNTISAGPIKTLAASGIGDFGQILAWNELNSPLKKNTTIDDVAGCAMWLLSDLGRGTTGELIHVDGGYNVNGMISVDEAGKIADLLSKFDSNQ